MHSNVKNVNLFGHRVSTDISNRIRYREDLISLRVGDLNAELLFKSHHHLHSIQGVQVQIILELCGWSNLRVSNL